MGRALCDLQTPNSKLCYFLPHLPQLSCVFLRLPFLGWFKRQEGKAPRGCVLGLPYFGPQIAMARDGFKSYSRPGPSTSAVATCAGPRMCLWLASGTRSLWFACTLIAPIWCLLENRKAVLVTAQLLGDFYFCRLMDGKLCLPYLWCANLCSQHTLAAVRCKLAQLVFLG